MAEETTENTETTETTENTDGLMANMDVKDNTPVDPNETISPIQEEEIKLEKPDNIPDKFWDDKNGTKIDNLVKSYNELEKKLSQKPSKAPENYALDGLEGVNSDDPMLSKYSEWAKDNNITQEAFTELAKTFIDGSLQAEENYKINLKKEREALGKNADAILESNIRWGRKMVNDGVLSNDDYEQLEILGGTAKGTRVIQKIRGMMGEKDIPIASIQGDAMTKEELFALVQDEKYAKDPVYRKSVEEKFQKYAS